MYQVFVVYDEKGFKDGEVYPWNLQSENLLAEECENRAAAEIAAKELRKVKDGRKVKIVPA